MQYRFELFPLVQSDFSAYKWLQSNAMSFKFYQQTKSAIL